MAKGNSSEKQARMKTLANLKKDPVRGCNIGASPLWVAVNAMQQATAEVLLTLGANPNDIDAHYNKSVLEVAIDKADLEMIRLLLDHQADVLQRPYSLLLAAERVDAKTQALIQTTVQNALGPESKPSKGGQLASPAQLMQKHALLGCKPPVKELEDDQSARQRVQAIKYLAGQAIKLASLRQQSPK